LDRYGTVNRTYALGLFFCCTSYFNAALPPDDTDVHSQWIASLADLGSQISIKMAGQLDLAEQAKVFNRPRQEMSDILIDLLYSIISSLHQKQETTLTN
jgi:hypothetical protein